MEIFIGSFYGNARLLHTFASWPRIRDVTWVPVESGVVTRCGGLEWGLAGLFRVSVVWVRLGWALQERKFGVCRNCDVVRMLRRLDWKFMLRIMCDEVLDCQMRDGLRMSFWFLGIWLSNDSGWWRIASVGWKLGGLDVQGR